MKYHLKTIFGKLTWGLLFSAMFVPSAYAQKEESRHELENMHVTIQAAQYKKGQFIETEVINGKEYIKGKSSSYNKKGEANAGTLLQPGAEYAVKTKLPGGTYNVTVYYAIDKEQVPDSAKISIGMNTQKAQHIAIKNKLVNSVKTSFKVNFIKGKHHTVKLWFPSAGVKVREIRIARALLPKKKESVNQ